MSDLEVIMGELLFKYEKARRKIFEMTSTDIDFAESELRQEIDEYRRRIKEASY